MIRFARNPTRKLASANDLLAHQIEFWLWGMFGLFMVCGFNVPPDEFTPPSLLYRVCNLLTYFCTFALVRLNILRFRKLHQASLNRNMWFGWLNPYLWVCMCGLLTGFLFIADKSWYTHDLGWEFLPMVTMSMTLFGRVVGGARHRFMRMMALQGAACGLLAVIVFARYPIAVGRADVNAPHFFMLAFCAFAVFPFAYLRHYSASLQIAALTGFAGFSFATLQYQSRGGSLLIFVVLPLAFLATQFRQGIMGILNVRTVAAGLLFLGAGAYWISRPEVRGQIEVGLDGTLSRLFSGDSSYSADGFRQSVEDEVEDARGAEAREFVAKSTPITWAIGHGWGGGWNSDIMKQGGDWQMVHFGPFHLVLKGGLPLLICFHILLFAGIIRSWRYVKRDSLAAPAFCYLIFFYGNFIKHGPMGHCYSTYLTWIILGIALTCSDQPSFWRVRPASSFATADPVLVAGS